MTDVGRCAQLACVWEATARKPGNVHRYHDLPGLTYLDFLHSALAVGPVLAAAGRRPVGETVYTCVRATRELVRTNTNLGIALLLAPLAAVPEDEPLRAGVARVLAALTVEDAVWAYRAIRLAVPGGLGEVPQQDVGGEPTAGLREAMGLAADRDTIARQYVTDFADVWEVGVTALEEGLRHGGGMEAAVVRAALVWMAERPDSLIARKRGAEAAREVARRAASVLAGGGAAGAFDAWLRAEGLNPGTTADLVTATLFVALREGRIGLPLAHQW